MIEASPTVAIATGILGRATETGVRRHIAHLFGGQTVVVCERMEPGFAPTRPTFALYPPDASLAERVAVEIGKGVQSLRYRCSGVPFGARRRALESFLRENRASAIVAEFGHIGANLAAVGNELGLPVIVYFRGFDASKRLQMARFVRHYRAMTPHVAGMVSVAQFLLDNLAAHGVTHPNTAVIPTGVDVRLFAPGEKDPHLVLAVGRIVAKKAPLILIDAFAAAAGEFPRHRLEIIGEGEMRGAAEARVRELGLAERVVFHGLKDHAFVRDRIARAGAFVQHSVTAADGNTEGLPTSIQEAMACGCAVVSTRHAGIPEAIDSGANGVLVDEHDSAGFAEALRGLLADEALAARLGAAARATALEKFDIDKLHAKLEAMILAATDPHT